MNTRENDETFLNELKKISQKKVNDDSYNKLKDLTKEKLTEEQELKIKKQDVEKQNVTKNIEKQAGKKFLTKKNDKKFSWEEKKQPYLIEPFEEYKLIEDKNLNKKEFVFDWEKREKIEEPNPENFEKNKTNYDWLKKQINPKEKEEKIFSKNNYNQFDWEKREKIEEPNPEDFERIMRVKWKTKNNKETFVKNDLGIEKNFEVEKKDYNDEKILEKNIEKDLEKKNIGEENFVKKPLWLKTKKQKNIKKTLKEEDFEKEEYSDLNSNKKLIKLKTPIDEMFEILEENNTTFLENIAQGTGMDYYKLEEISKMFEEYGIIDLKYSANLKAKARVILKKKVESKIKEIPKGEILNDYNIEVDKVPARIKIISIKEDIRPVYAIEMPGIGKYTKKFLDFIKSEIAESMPIELEEIVDPKKSKTLKTRFFEESKKHLTKYFSTSSEETLDVLSGIVLHEMYGLGSIDVILGDDMLEEVAINSSKTPIAVYHRIHGWMKTNLFPGTEEEIMNYSSQIGRKIGREITTLNPILDAHLLSGDRVNATLFPVSSEGNTLTIRRFARKPWTLIDFIGKAHTMSSEMAALLWLAMQYEMNIIISGGTASGKTSALNTLLALVPSYHRIISIEDVREIILPKYLMWNWIPMITRSANPEGLGEVTMLDCMISSLRMRPDRIIVGEIRRKKEAEVLMEAIETGHSIYSTIHANSAYQVLRRMAEPPISIPIMQLELIDLIVVQFRDRKTNKRRTFEIAEIEPTSAGKGLQVNTIYKWLPRNDSWDQLNKPNKLLTTLNQHTGLTEDEINKELEDRTKILDWLQEQNINNLDQIGFIVKLFYADPDKVKKMASQKTSKEEIDEMIDK